MFKKTILAVALTSAVSFANAGTLAEPNLSVALEGSIAAGVYTPAAAAVLTTATAYVANDVVTFTYTGATVKSDSAPSVANSTPGNTLSYIDTINGNTVRFRVDANGVASGDVLTLTGVNLVTTAAADKAEVKVASVAISTNPVIGNYDASAAKKIATFNKQFSLTVATAFDETLALDKGRKEFSALNDTLALTLADNAGLSAITHTKFTHTITGQNLSYLMDYDLVANGGNANGSLSATELATAITVTDGADTTVLSIDAGMTTITAVQTAAVAGTVVSPSYQFNVIGQTLGGSVIAAQTFTASTVASDGTISADTGAKAAGKWSLGADVTRVPFMPFGSAYSQSITVSNRFAAAGEISIDWYVNGTTVSTPLTVSAAAKSITDISAAVRATAAANGITGNATFDVVVNVPDTNADVVAVYYAKSDKDRAVIAN